MDFILLKKILTLFVYPLGLVILLWCVSGIFAWSKKRFMSRFCKVLAIVIFLVSSNPLASRWLARSLEHQYPQRPISEIGNRDAIVVLGGGLRLPLPPAQQTQIGAGSDRYWYAVQLFQAGKADKIVLTGGNVFRQSGYQSEAYYAAELLQRWGVPSEAIVVEGNSRTTAQNAELSRAVLKAHELSSVLLVTSALHMPRAITQFQKLGLDVTPASADILVQELYQPGILNWIPSASALLLTTVSVHEYIGRWVDQLTGDLKSL